MERNACAGTKAEFRKRGNDHKRRLASLLISTAILGSAGLLVPAAAHAQQQSAGETVKFNIPSQSLRSAINAFTRATGWEVGFTSAAIDGKRSASVSGSMMPAQALRALVAGAGVSVQISGPSTAALVAASAGGAGKVDANGSTVLETITVQGQGAISEGTGSYVAPAPSTLGTPFNLTEKETPQATSVVTKQRMDDESLTSLRDVLNQTAGLSVQDIGDSRYSIVSRGYGVSTYQLDGVNTSFDIQTVNVPQSLSDMVIYDRIEVLRGASGLMTGAGDPSGTVNLVRKKPTETYQGYVSGTYGSWDKRRIEGDISGPLNADGTLRGRLVGALNGANSFVDYYDAKGGIIYGTVEADLTDNTTVSLGVDHQRVNTEGSSYNVGFPLFFDDGKQTDFDRSYNPSGRGSYNNVGTTNIATSLSHEFSEDWKLNAKANFLTSKRDSQRVDFSSSYTFPNEGTGDGLNLGANNILNRQKQISADVNLQGKFDAFGREHDLVFGASYTRSTTGVDYFADTSGLDGTPTNIYTWDGSGSPVAGPRTADEAYRRSQIAAYAATRLEVTDSLKTILGARLFGYRDFYEWGSHDYSSGSDVRTYGGGSEAKENAIFTPYFGAVYDLNDQHSLYGSIATIYKPTSSQDRNGSFLDPVQGTNYEIGLKSDYLEGRLRTNVALYHIKQDNLATADDGYTVPGTFNQAYRTVKGATTNGFEVEVSGEVLDGWNVMTSYTYSRSEDAEEKRITTTFPEHMVKLWTTYRLPGDWDKLTVGAGLTWQSAIYYTASPWYASTTLNAQQDAFAVVNLMAKYEFPQNVTATLNVNNLFDEKYLTSLDSNFYTGYYGAPRNVTFDLKYKF